MTEEGQGLNLIKGSLSIKGSKDNRESVITKENQDNNLLMKGLKKRKLWKGSTVSISSNGLKLGLETTLRNSRQQSSYLPEEGKSGF